MQRNWTDDLPTSLNTSCMYTSVITSVAFSSIALLLIISAYLNHLPSVHQPDRLKPQQLSQEYILGES